jgi:NAD(P)-dependent dehydrogenase (short-subunit alcohol dehydrogenase family)
MRVLVTGGSRGIGKSVVENFIKHGHNVYCPSREELDLKLEAELSDTNFDIVINNAGINPLKSLQSVNDYEVMKINYFAPLYIIQQCLPYMINQKYGRIINIGSIWIDFAKPLRSAYAASKAALHSLTKSLTSEYAAHNILTNTISPGFIATDLTFKNNSKKDIKNIISDIPVKRLGTTQEIADLVLFLSINNNFISGQNIVIDGGYSCCA